MRLAQAFLVLVALATEAFTSGGAEIQITHDEAEIFVATSRKRPMPGDEAEYAKSMDAWEKANRPVVERALAAIEQVLPRYRKKLALVPRRFDAPRYNELSSEGVVRGGGDDDDGWRLTIDLDLYPGAYIENRVRFVFAARPSKADIRAFSREVEAAALKSLGRALPPSPSYTAYWLGDETLLLSAVPLSKLPDALSATPWRAPSFEAFRRAPALLVTTAAKRHVTVNPTGFMLAHPTAAKLADDGKLVLQVNGTYLPGMTSQKATRAEVVKLFDNAADPKAAREELEDNLEFLASLKPQLAK